MLRRLNALRYVIVPDVDVPEQSNPNVLDATISAPAFFGKFGRAPSNPPWNGTMNLRVVELILVANELDNNADSNDPLYTEPFGYATSAFCDISPK